MNIRELKEMISELDDDMEVMIPMPFDDEVMLVTPCTDESGEMEIEMGDGKSEIAFCLICEDFFNDVEFEEFDPTLN